MNSIALSVGIVGPMFLLMLSGLLLREFHLIKPAGFTEMNRVCFYLLLPASLLNSLMSSKDFSSLTLPFLGWLLLCQVIILGLLFLFVPLVVKENGARASIIQAGFRSNFLMFGILIAGALCGEEKLGLVSISAGILIPLYNIGGILILQHYCGGKVKPIESVKRILTNPFVIACVLGLLIYALPFKLPEIVTSAISKMASAATTVAFIALGGSTDLSKLKRVGRNVILGTVLRLVILPAILILLTVLLGMRDIQLVTIVVMVISPTAVATYALAERMGADADLAGYLVAAQSVFSILTIFLWLWGLSGLRLI